jgi:hypothetical protein
VRTATSVRRRRSIKKLLVGAVGILAIEILLLWGYFGLVGEGVGITNRHAAVALLVGTVSVLVWVGFVWGPGRLVLATVGCVVVTYAALVVTVFVDFPAAVVCERGTTPNVEVSSTRIHGYFEEHRIGLCVAYTHHSRAPGGAVGGD